MTPRRRMIFFHSNLLISSVSSLGAHHSRTEYFVFSSGTFLIRPLQPQLKLQVQLENHNLFNNDGETQNWISFNFWTSQHFQFILDFRMNSIYQFQYRWFSVFQYPYWKISRSYAWLYNSKTHSTEIYSFYLVFLKIGSWARPYY